MTKTIFGKKLLMLATITVLVTGLMMSASFDDAEAKKAKTGTHDLKCKKSIGSFFDPAVSTGTPIGNLLISTSEGKCKFLKHTAFANITTVTAVDVGTGCVTLETPVGVDSYAIGKKGFFTFSMILEQCFFESDGVTPTLSALTEDYCDTGVSTDVFTSTVTGTYLITGGELHDKKHGSTAITGGSGTVTSSVDHCAMSTAPYGNSVVTEMIGTIVFP